MQQILFIQAYDIQEQNYGLIKYNKCLHEIHKVNKKRFPGDNSKDEAISVHFKNNEITNNQEYFQALQKLKYIGVLQPIEAFIEQNQTILIYQDYLMHGLLEENFQILIGEGHGYRMLLQLALTFAELERRNMKWPLELLQQLYYIDGLLFLSLADYDFFSKSLQLSQFDIFKTFYDYNFRYFCPEIQQLLNQKSFKPIIEFLLEFQKITFDIFQEPHENLLKYLLNISKFELIYKRGNICVIKGFKTPQVLIKIFPKLAGEQNLVYKLKQACGNDDEGVQSNNIKREIELMEQFSEQSATASCFAYFRIDNLPFLLQKKYVGTLSDALRCWNPNEQQLKKDVYTFSQRFASALVEFHSKNIIHRDLKPENLFMDSTSLTSAWVFIADFDRSKQIQGEQNMDITQENTANTQKYDPPEGDYQTLKYDIFQYGLIILTIANKGQYVGLAKGPRFMEEQEFNSFYSYQSIKQKLGQHGYEDTFVDIIHQCLKRNPAERPDAQQVYEIVNKLNFRSKIRLLSQKII